MAYLTPRKKMTRQGPVGIEGPDGHANTLRVSNPDDMAMDIGNFGRQDKDVRDKTR